MPEPTGIATLMGKVCPGVYRYSMHDDRIDYQSDCYLIVSQDRVVLLDPLPMEEKVLHRHGPIDAIVLTASCHERSAWRYRKAFKLPVYGPQGGVDFEETPDRWYQAGDRLPGDLVAVHAPGPTEAHYAFYLERDQGVVFCADLITNDDEEGLVFVPDVYQDEPRRTRDSVRRLLDLTFEILCPNHGDPIRHGSKTAIRQLLARDQAGSGS